MRNGHLIGIGLAAAATLLGAATVQAADRPQKLPLADAQLFIAPSGQPFRSKPGDPYPVVAWFEKTDANHDGKLDRAEFRAEAADFFHQLDIHKNGIVDDHIIGLYEKNVVPEILAGFHPAMLWGDGDAKLIQVQQYGSIGQPGGPPIVENPEPQTHTTPDADLPQGAMAYSLLKDAEPLRSADRSFLGRLKLQDMLDQADRNFDALDFDHKGYLTLDDLPRTPVQQRAAAARVKR